MTIGGIQTEKLVPDGAVLSGIGLAYWMFGLTLLTAAGGLVLVCFRIAIASQEFRINRIKLQSSNVEVLDEPGA